MRGRVGITLGIVQFFFSLSWTVYVLFLPGLATKVGLASAVPAVLLLDQALFALTDLWVGARTDSALSMLVRFERPLLAAVAASTVAFVVLPLAGSWASPSLLLIAIVVWVVTSSALRVPPLALLGRYAGPKGATTGAALYAAGLGVAGAIAPYVTMRLRDRNPLLPFVAASIAVMLATLSLTWAMRSVGAGSEPKTEEPAIESKPRLDLGLVVLVAAGLTALAVQIHFAVRSAALFSRLGGAGSLSKLMPVFWVGFNLALYPVSRLLAKHSPLRVLAFATFAGGVATLGVEGARMLPIAVVAQFFAGAAWAAAFLASLGGCAAFGHVGTEGRLFGRFFAILAGATFLRMALVAAHFDQAPALSWLLRVVPAVAWILAGAIALRKASRVAST